MKQRCDKICQFCHFNFLNNFRQSSPYDNIFLSKTSNFQVCNIKFNFIGFEAVKTLNA